MTVIHNTARPAPLQASVEGSSAARAPSSTPAELMPLPAAAGDDLMTSIAILGMKAKQNDRVAADQQRIVSEKTQEEAQSRKIAKMREVADETFTQGLIEGVMEGASAACTAVSAVDEFNSRTDGAEAETLEKGSAKATKLGKESRALARESKLFDAAGKGLSATARFGSACAKAAQEDDKADIAVADRDVDRAKAAVDAASAASRRADDDIRETLNNIRQYLAAKSQLANAAIIKG